MVGSAPAAYAAEPAVRANPVKATITKAWILIQPPQLVDLFSATLDAGTNPKFNTCVAPDQPRVLIAVLKT
jgi:hypothetical protein